MKLLFLILFSAPCWALTDIDNEIAGTHIEFEFPDAVFVPKCEVRGNPLDLLIVLDVSGSLRKEFDYSIEVVKRVLGAVAISKETTRVGMVTYSKKPYTYFHYDTYDNRFHIENAIGNILPVHATTYTGAALKYVPTELSKAFGMRGPEVPKIIFLITDGKSHDYPEDVKNAKILRTKHKQQIWVFGTGDYPDFNNLANITGDPNKVVTKKTLDKLDVLFSEWKGVEICEPVPVCIPGSAKPLDLMFIVDSSNSLEEGKSFREQINFMHRALNLVNVHPEATKVSLITYSSNSYLEFDFDKFNLNDDVHQYIDTRIRAQNGTTQTREALQTAFETFEPQYGTRNNVQKMAIVLSDGHAAKNPEAIARRLTRIKDIIVVAVAVSPPNYVDPAGLLRITDQHLERVFHQGNLDTFEDFMFEYVDFNCPGMNISGKNAKPVVKQPIQAKCSSNGIEITVETVKPFHGIIHAFDYADKSSCRVGGRGLTSTSITLLEDDCGVVKSVGPDRTGYNFNATVRIQFHKQVMTKADDVKEMTCFYKASVPMSITDEQLLTEKDTLCSYSLHNYGPTGCTALAANIGTMLYHKWTCGLPKGSFTKFLVHNCFAEFDDKSIQLLDDDGCEIDPVLLETPDYTQQEYVTQQARSFMFPETVNIRYRCLISTCDMDSAAKCKHMIPPTCGGKRKKRAVKPRTKNGFLHTYSVQTRTLNVIDEAKMFKTGERFCYG